MPKNIVYLHSHAKLKRSPKLEFRIPRYLSASTFLDILFPESVYTRIIR